MQRPMMDYELNYSSKGRANDSKKESLVVVFFCFFRSNSFTGISLGRSQPGPARRFIMVATELLINRVVHRRQLVD